MIDLYIKPGCPWCTKAMEWLDSHGFKYIKRDVTIDRENAREMRNLTGQTLAPSIRVHIPEGTDLILADFGPEELEAFVKKHKLKP
jgi:monothiol glutaredoxin